MSLEELLTRNNELLTEHNDLLRTIIGSAKKNGASGDDTAKATKATKAKADKGADDDGTADKLAAAIKKASTWLGEFKANEADPETEERKTKFRAALDKIGYKTAKEITKAEDVERFDKWIDKMIAAGRITPEPSDDEGTSPDEDDI